MFNLFSTWKLSRDTKRFEKRFTPVQHNFESFRSVLINLSGAKSWTEYVLIVKHPLDEYGGANILLPVTVFLLHASSFIRFVPIL